MVYGPLQLFFIFYFLFFMFIFSLYNETRFQKIRLIKKSPKDEEMKTSSFVSPTIYMHLCFILSLSHTPFTPLSLSLSPKHTLSLSPLLTPLSLILSLSPSPKSTLSLSLSYSLSPSSMHSLPFSYFIPSLFLCPSLLNLLKFRISLGKALADATGHFEVVSADSRIGPLLKVIPDRTESS